MILVMNTKPVNIHFCALCLIGYSSLEYPVISTGLQNKMDVRVRVITFPAEF